MGNASRAHRRKSGSSGGLGFDGIELTVRRGYTTELSQLDAAERRRILALLAQHHLALPGLHAGIELLDGDVAANLAGMRAAVDLSVDLATDNHPPVISTVMGGRPGELPALRPQLVEYLGDLAAYAAPRGVIIAVEPHVSTVLDRPEQVGPLLDEINSPFLRATFDISHFNVQGMPIEETVAIMAPLAAHTHVKDERGRAPHHEFLIPGEGEFDYVRYLRAMRLLATMGSSPWKSVSWCNGGLIMILLLRPRSHMRCSLVRSSRQVSPERYKEDQGWDRHGGIIIADPPSLPNSRT